MKLAQISLTAIMLIGMTSFASDSLENTFVNGKFDGELRFLYASGSKSDVAATNPVNNSNTGSIALEVNYLTAPYYDFELGLGAQTGYDLRFHDKDGSSEDDSRNTVTTSYISGLFLKYSFLKSNIKVGRQTIKLPLLMNSSAFPLKDTFDAVSFVSKELPETLINLVYVNSWNKRYNNDSTGSVVQEDVDYNKPLYSIYIKNSSIENLVIDTQYLTTNEEDNNGDAPILISGGYDEYFIRTDYKLPISFPLSFGMLYGNASFDAKGKKDTSFYGVKLGTNIDEVNLELAYTSVDDDNDFPGTLGHVPDALFYTSMLTNQAIFAGIEAISFQAKYNFGINGLNTIGKIAHFKQSDKGISNSSANVGKSDEVNIDIKYEFSGVLKGFSTRFYAGYGKYDEDVDKDTFTYSRLYINYKF